MENKDLDAIMKDCQSVLNSCRNLDKELKWMNDDIEFLQNEYKTNKKYFCNEGSKPTINDVIKCVYEFAWASKRNFDNQ